MNEGQFVQIRNHLQEIISLQKQQLELLRGLQRPAQPDALIETVTPKAEPKPKAKSRGKEK